MKKVLSLLFVICYLLFGYSVTRAAGPGINIGTKYSDIDPAINVVGPGGWIVVIAGGTGDCANLNNIIAKTDAANVNLIIRGHLGNKLSPQDAIAWTATLGQLKNSKKVYFMPWNEPNQDGSADAGTPSEVIAYTSALISNMTAAGIWDSKIRLLSPMLNETHPNFDFYLSQLGGSGFYSPFYGAAMNLYDVDTDDGTCTGGGYQPLCSNNPRYNPTMATSFAGGKPVFGVESGPAGTYFYFKSSPGAGGFVHSFVNKFKDQSNAVMFAIPSYDLAGEVGHNWSLFSPADTVNLLKNMPKNGTEGASMNQTQFDNWLNPLKANGELISCGTCGFAHSSNPGLCNGSGGLGNFTLPAECDLNNPGDKTSRPAPCNLCNQTPKMVSDCATDFKVLDKVSYQKNEGDQCNGQYWVEKSWGGTVSFDLNSAEIPFVGKKNEENEQYYLADYFEGTYPYYQQSAQTPYNLKSAEDQRQAFMQAGVWQKLSTREMQDTMKINMIRRAIASKNGTITEGVIRDYNVVFNGVTKQLSLFDGHFPPADEVERADWVKNDEFGRLWFMVPMFTREDTKGSVVPYLGSMQKDQFTIQDFEKNTIEKVPHVARLYEVTRAINQLLLPAARQALSTDRGSQTNLASTTTKPKLLASNEVLLAEAVVDTFNISANASYSEPNVFVWVTFNSQGCDGDIKLAVNGAITAGPNGWNAASPYTYEPRWTGSPVVVNRGQSQTVTYTGIIHRGPRNCTHQTSSVACTFTVDAAGNFTTNCGPPGPPAPVCGSFTAQTVPVCKKEAESGPGDSICCGTINASLNAVDRIANDQYTGCDSNLYPLGVGDPCHDTVSSDVERRLGVALSHPYLENIWNDTTDSISGFINLWKLAETPAFEPKEAKSSISYSYSSNNRNPNIEPSTGDFYYPYLGGIFNAKNWLVNTLLTKQQQDQQAGP